MWSAPWIFGVIVLLKDDNSIPAIGFKGLLSDFGNEHPLSRLLPQSQMNSWIPSLCLCVQFDGSC
jgi:hypothetical protein